MTATATASLAENLLLRARGVGLCAHLLGDRMRPEAVDAANEELRDVLAALHLDDVIPLLDSLGKDAVADSMKTLARGEISPYEGGYEAGAGAAGGVTFRLADISGFYRAFGFEVSGDRPDHIVPELEFVALLCAKEAYARLAGEEEGARVCGEARRKFLTEHLCEWLPEFSQRISERGPHPALETLTTIIDRLTAADRES